MGTALFAFVCQGTRGLWEPDEGFYSNPALEMLWSGDWWTPRLNGQPFLDKPPLIYWSIASGMKLLGVNESGARAAHALFFAGTALLIGLLGARWWGRREGVIAGLVYATSLAPYLAANVLTPDTPLAFCSVLSYYAFWRLEEGERNHHRILWGLIVGVALGFGALAKGPAILVLGAPLAVLAVWRRRRAGRWLPEPALWCAGAVFLALAAPWYLSMARHFPGATAYMFDNQVIGRLITEKYHRNAAWFGPIAVYLPTLSVGFLPWSPLLSMKLWRARASGSRALVARLRVGSPSLMLLLWFSLPLAVFAVARSRLPLYVLPLFAPLALVTARVLGKRPFRPRLLTSLCIATWMVALLSLKLFAGHLSDHHDTRWLAHELADIGIARSRLIVLVDVKANGLPLYGYPRVEQVTFSERPYPFYSPPETVAEELEEIEEQRITPLLVVPRARAERLTRVLSAHGIPFAKRPPGRFYSFVDVKGR